MADCCGEIFDNCNGQFVKVVLWRIWWLKMIFFLRSAMVRNLQTITVFCAFHSTVMTPKKLGENNIRGSKSVFRP